jgi:hypothetical protein
VTEGNSNPDLWDHNLIRPLALRELPDLKAGRLRFRFAAGDPQVTIRAL